MQVTKVIHTAFFAPNVRAIEKTFLNKLFNQSKLPQNHFENIDIVQIKFMWFIKGQLRIIFSLLEYKT